MHHTAHKANHGSSMSNSSGRFVSILAILVALLLCSTGRHVLLPNNSSSDAVGPTLRALLLSKAESTIGSSHYVTHHGHNIPGTSTPSLPYVVKALLENKTSSITALNVSDSSPAVGNSLRQSIHELFAQDIPHDKVKRNKLLEGINHNDNLNKATHSLRGLGAQSDETIPDLVDVVIPITSTSEASLTFLSSWKNCIKELHVIIILAQGISIQSLNAPEWLDYIVYTRTDVERVLGENDAWIIPSTGYSIATFAYFVADRKFVYTLQPNTIPPPVISLYGEQPQDQQSVAKNMNIIQHHVHNLLTPSNMNYFDTYYDPYKRGHDFSRGTPYSLRTGQPTGISHGLVVDAIDEFDALTRLAHSQDSKEYTPRNQGGSGYNDITTVVPKGQLYSRSMQNIAFNRELVGVLMFPTVQQLHDHDPISAMGDIINGWIVKLVMDAMGAGTKSGAPYVISNKDNVSSLQFDMDEEIEKLQSEFQSYFWLEDLYTFFSTLDLPNLTNRDARELLGDIITLIEKGAGHLGPYIQKLCDMLRIWNKHWDNHHAFMSTEVAVSSYSSLLGHRRNTTLCAAVTITHNEKLMLPKWTKYYSRQLASPSDVFVLDHNSNDNSTKEIPAGVRVLALHGDKAGFPLAFMNRKAEEQMTRLLRAGYPCVIFADTDEFLIPDPHAYPGGLKQYLAKFIADSSIKHRRTSGRELSHISYGNGSYSFDGKWNHTFTDIEIENIRAKYGYIEGPINWSKPLFVQRRYWAPVAKYSKPLLTKIPIRYRPGFHNNFIGPMVIQDSELYLVHLRSADYTFCLEHERAKYETSKRMHESEKMQGFNDHITKFEQMMKSGNVCAFAVGCFIGPWIGNRTALFDTTGHIRLEKMDEGWLHVDF